MRGQRRQRRLRVAGGRPRLEPEHATAEHPPSPELAAHRGLDGAEVFADDEGPGTRALEGDDVEQLGRRVANVSAVRRVATERDPPEPKEAHDMVDPEPASVAEARAQGFDEGR